MLWFEHDLFDQLLLIRTLDLLDGRSAKVSLICIGAFPGFERFVGLGQLNADQLASLAPARVLVTQRHYAIARDVWKEPRRATPLDNVIDVQMTRLRKKVDTEGHVRLIHTVRGVGFIVKESEP